MRRRLMNYKLLLAALSLSFITACGEKEDTAASEDTSTEEESEDTAA